MRSLEASHLYRRMRSVIVSGPTAVVDGKKVIHLCSNDYLGLSQNPKVIKKTAQALTEVSQCSSRLIAGNHPKFSELEVILAEHRKTDSALVFPTGYMANLGAVTALANRETTLLSDELNHASIIDACRLSGAKIRVFRHNDIDDLEDLMRKTKGRKIILTEGVFSMDGDLSHLKHICNLAHKHDALTILDDAHGDFVYGPHFSGVASMLNADVDVHISSLSKGLGCFGGYVATSTDNTELFVNTSKQFIYTSALPEHLCVAALEALKLAKRGNLQSRLFKNISFIRRKLRRLGFDIGASTSQIIPIMVGSEELASHFSMELLNSGVFAQAIRYPTVKKGEARIRISVTAAHSTKQLNQALDSLRNVGSRSKVIP